MIPVTSSFIHAIGYDPRTRKLTVEFKKRGGYSIYQYDNVAVQTYARWLKSPSKGQYFHRNIRNRFSARKVA